MLFLQRPSHDFTTFFSNHTHISREDCFFSSRASLVAQLVKNLPAMQETWVDPWGQKIAWRRERLPTPVSWPGEFHGLYSPRGRKELDTTEGLSLLLFPWVAEEFLQSHYISFWRMHRGFRGFSLSVYTVWLGMGRVEPRGAGRGLPRFTRDALRFLYM